MTEIWALEMHKQFLRTMRGLFRAGFGAFDVVQDQADRYVTGFAEQGTETNQAAVEMMRQWLATIKRGQEEFRALVDESFQRAEEFFDSLAESAAGSKKE